MNEHDDFDFYMTVIEPGSYAVVRLEGDLRQIYQEMSEHLGVSYEWALYSIEHKDSDEVLMSGRMTPEAWKVYGDSWHAFKTFLEYFSPDFDERVNAALYGAAEVS